MTKRLINEYIQTTIQTAIDGGYAVLRETNYLADADRIRVTVHIGKFKVRIYKKECILDIGEIPREEGPSTYAKIWKNDVGGLIVKDVKRGNVGLYKEIVIGPVTKCLVREMTREEVEQSIQDDKPYSIVVYNKETSPEYYCIIKVIEVDKSYSDPGESWYSEIYNPEEDDELRKKLEKEERAEAIEEENEEDDGPHFADLGLGYGDQSDYE